MGRTQMVYDIRGIVALDYFDLYRKFTYTNQESYRLDHIAEVELGITKDENYMKLLEIGIQKTINHLLIIILKMWNLLMH